MKKPSGTVRDSEVHRELVIPKVDKGGLIVQPDFGDDETKWAAFEVIENHRRDGAAILADYANKWGNGRTRAFDPKGNYACGDCNRHVDADDGVVGNEDSQPRCTLLPWTFIIDLFRGSCKKWEDWCAGDQETFFAKIRKAGQYTAQILAYGVALAKDGRDGKGFGCHRCGLKQKAYRKDSKGRVWFCRWWGARIDWNDCCGDNDAPSTEYDGNKIVGGGNHDAEKRPEKRANRRAEMMLKRGLISQKQYDKMVGK